MNPRGRHGRNFAWLFGSEIAQRFLSVFLFLYLNYRLSVEQNGWYGLFAAIFPLLAVVANFGLSDVITREVAQRPDRAYDLVRRSFLVQATVFPFLFLIVYFGSRLVDVPPVIPSLMTIGCGAALFVAVSRVNFAVLGAHHNFLPVSSVAVLVRALIVAGSIAVLELGYGVRAMIAVIVPAYALQFALAHFLNRRLRVPPSTPVNTYSPRQLAAEGFPIALGGLAATAFVAMDLPLLYALNDADEAGYYALGVRLYLTLAVLPEILGTLAYPALSAIAAGPPQAQAAALGGALKAAWLMLAPVAAGLILCGDAVLAVIADTAYSAAVPAVAVLSGVLLIEGLNYMLVIFLRAKGMQRVPLLTYAAANAIKLAAAILLVPLYGQTALLALSATLAALMTVALATISFRTLQLRGQLSAAARIATRPLLPVLILIAVLWSTRSLHLSIILPAAILAYTATLILTRTLTPSDWKVIRSVLRRES